MIDPDVADLQDEDLIWLSRLNLQAGLWDIFWPKLIQGASLSLLFVPLTTASMSAISREKMGNATSLFNLMRNIGGSIGIAMTGTMLVRQQQAVTTLLGSHVNAYDPASQAMFARIRGGFIAAGADPVTWRRTGPTPRSSGAWRQASMVSFVTIFQILGLVFIALIPLVLIMKRPAHQGAPPPAAH